MNQDTDKIKIKLNSSSLNDCIYCHSFCKSKCPSFNISKNECFLPRNISYLYNLYKNKRLKISEDFLEILYSCIICSQCEINCVYDDKDFINNILKIRNELFSEHPKLLPKKILETLRNVNTQQNIFGELKKKLVTENKYYNNTSENLIFTGCFINYKVPEFFENMSKFMNENGYEYKLFDDEVCCGAPSYYAGDFDSAKESVINLKKKLDEDNISKLIILCPTGYKFLKDIFGKLDIKLKAEIVFYTEILDSIVKDRDKDDSAKNKENSRTILIKPGELYRNSEIIEVIEENLNINKDNLDFSKNQSYYSNCGGCLNLFTENDIKNHIDDIIDIIKPRRDDIIVTVSPVCYYYFKKYGTDILVKEYFDYLS